MISSVVFLWERLCGGVTWIGRDFEISWRWRERFSYFNELDEVSFSVVFVKV